MGFWTGLADSVNNNGQHYIDRERRQIEAVRTRYGSTITPEQERNIQRHEQELRIKQDNIDRARIATEEWRRRGI